MLSFITNYSLVITAICSMVTALVALIGVFLAIYQLNSWRRELKGRKHIELAEEVLVLFYEARAKISYLRSPFSSKDEGSSRARDSNETVEEMKIKDRAYILIERYQKNQENFNKLFSLRFRFAVYFGIETIIHFDDLQKLLNQLFLACWELAHYWRAQGKIMTENERQLHLTNMHKAEALIWAGYDKPDQIEERIDAIISKIEKLCQKIF